MIAVHNLNNTGNKNPPAGYSSWRLWWQTQTGKMFCLCSRVGCNNFADVGAHVQKEGSADKSWYIVPLCTACNNISSKEAFLVDAENMVSLY
jgi:hypothetical protein